MNDFLGLYARDNENKHKDVMNKKFLSQLSTLMEPEAYNHCCKADILPALYGGASISGVSKSKAWLYDGLGYAGTHREDNGVSFCNCSLEVMLDTSGLQPEEARLMEVVAKIATSKTWYFLSNRYCFHVTKILIHYMHYLSTSLCMCHDHRSAPSVIDFNNWIHGLVSKNSSRGPQDSSVGDLYFIKKSLILLPSWASKSDQCIMYRQRPGDIITGSLPHCVSGGMSFSNVAWNFLNYMDLHDCVTSELRLRGDLQSAVETSLDVTGGRLQVPN